jgi:hypothetical protein
MYISLIKLNLIQYIIVTSYFILVYLNLLHISLVISNVCSVLFVFLLHSEFDQTHLVAMYECFHLGKLSTDMHNKLVPKPVQY